MQFFTLFSACTVIALLVCGATAIIAAGFVYFEHQFGVSWACFYLWAVSAVTTAFLLLLSGYVR